MRKTDERPRSGATSSNREANATAGEAHSASDGMVLAAHVLEEDSMPERNPDRGGRQRKTDPDEKTVKRGAPNRGVTGDHRLRGADFADDFADADADSSVVSSRRDDKESDS